MRSTVHLLVLSKTTFPFWAHRSASLPPVWSAWAQTVVANWLRLKIEALVRLLHPYSQYTELLLCLALMLPSRYLLFAAAFVSADKTWWWKKDWPCEEDEYTRLPTTKYQVPLTCHQNFPRQCRKKNAFACVQVNSSVIKMKINGSRTSISGHLRFCIVKQSMTKIQILINLKSGRWNWTSQVAFIKNGLWHSILILLWTARSASPFSNVRVHFRKRWLNLSLTTCVNLVDMIVACCFLKRKEIPKKRKISALIENLPIGNFEEHQTNVSSTSTFWSLHSF